MLSEFCFCNHSWEPLGPLQGTLLELFLVRVAGTALGPYSVFVWCHVCLSMGGRGIFATSEFPLHPFMFFLCSKTCFAKLLFRLFLFEPWLAIEGEVFHFGSENPFRDTLNVTLCYKTNCNRTRFKLDFSTP